MGVSLKRNPKAAPDKVSLELRSRNKQLNTVALIQGTCRNPSIQGFETSHASISVNTGLKLAASSLKTRAKREILSCSVVEKKL